MEERCWKNNSVKHISKKNFNFVYQKKNKHTMGKGDKKTAKGKRVMGSYGNVRKRKTSKVIVASAKTKTAEKSLAKKATHKAAAPKAVKKTTKTPKADA